jgi:hypothetical protein
MAGIETKNPKHQTMGAASTVETPVELYPGSVKELSGRLPILIPSLARIMHFSALAIFSEGALLV